MQLMLRDGSFGPFLTQVLTKAQADDKLSQAELQQIKSKAVLMSLKFADKFYNKYKMHLLEQAAYDVIGIVSLGLQELAHDDQQQALVPQLEGINLQMLRLFVYRAATLHQENPWWYRGCEGMRPPVLLNLLREASRPSGPNRQFHHLDDLCDARVADNGGELRVLRSRHAVANVAERLHNCAAMYSRRCEEQTYVLVGLFDGDHPTALGGYRRNTDGWAVDQVVMQCNGSPTPTVRQLFDRYIDVIQEWHRNSSSKRKEKAGKTNQPQS